MSFLRSSSVRKPSSSKRPTSPVRMKRLPVSSYHSASAVFARLVVIAAHHRGGRAADDLAGFAGRHLAAVVVDEADVVARRGWPTVCSLSGMLVGAQDAGAAAFGHAVVLDQAARPALEHVGLERGGERRAGAELHAEARQVVAIEVGQVHHALVLHRHEHRVGGAVPLGELREARGVELRHQHDGAAERERREEADERRVRVERGRAAS